MSKSNAIIFEEINKDTRLIIQWYLFRRYKIFFLRINYLCKERKWIKGFIEKGLLTKIDESLNLLPRAVGLLETPAYQNIDRVFKFLMADNKIVGNLVKLYGNKRICVVFKQSLLGYLQRFYYINFVLHELNKVFPEQEICFVQALNKEGYRNYILGVNEYYAFKDFMSKSGSFYYENNNIVFPVWFKVISKLNDWLRFMALQITITGFLFWSIVISFLNLLKIKKQKRENYKFGITIVAPIRQFANKIQKVDFLIDENYINKNDVLFIYWKKLSKANRGYIQENSLNLAENLLSGLSLKTGLKIIPSALAILSRSFKYRDKLFILESARLQLICYAMWNSFKDKYHIDNLVSYCDFGPHSITRNIILSMAGTKSWFWVDSINWNYAFISEKNKSKVSMYNSRIGFLYYDYFISWSDEEIRHLKFHPVDIKNYINVGCLWASHIREIERGKINSNFLNVLRKQGFKGGHKLISVFDSTYADDTFTTYDDGIRFLRAIYRLLDDISAVFIVFKEKKARSYVKKYSKEMIFWLEELENHARCYLPLQDMNSSEAIAFSDLTVSFPFTSTAFEALSARKKAIYYDASDKFRGTLYDKIPGLVCHNYDELLSRVKELLFDIDTPEYNEYLDKFVKGRLEPYLDGNALDRFRKLLINSG